MISKPNNHFYEFGLFQLDPFHRVLMRQDGTVVTISPKAFDLLLTLVENSGRLLSKDDLLQRVWNGSFVEEGNLTQTISVLRKTLGEQKGDHRFIVTQPGQGYRFVAEVREVTKDVSQPLIADSTEAIDHRLNGNAAVQSNGNGTGNVNHRESLRHDGRTLWRHDVWAIALTVLVLGAIVGAAFYISSKPEPRLVIGQTTSSDAQQRYLRARYLFNKRTPEGLVKAVEYFEQAVALDPNYAAAQVGLAEAYATLNHYDPSPSQWSFSKARAAAERALELDETLAEAHSVLAAIKYNYEFDWVGAEKEFQRAISLNPNYATAHHWYAESLLYQGRLDEAGVEIERAYNLDPVSPIINAERAAVLLYKGKTEEAIQRYRKVLELEPNFTVALYGLGVGYERQSQYQEAIAVYKRMTSITGIACLGYVYAIAGQENEARSVLKQLQEKREQKHSSAYLLAMVHAGLGEKEQALVQLEKAFEDRDARLVLLKIDSHFESLRSEPRFQQLLRRLRLAS